MNLYCLRPSCGAPAIVEELPSGEKVRCSACNAARVNGVPNAICKGFGSREEYEKLYDKSTKEKESLLIGNVGQADTDCTTDHGTAQRHVSAGGGPAPGPLKNTTQNEDMPHCSSIMQAVEVSGHGECRDHAKPTSGGSRQAAPRRGERAKGQGRKTVPPQSAPVAMDEPSKEREAGRIEASVRASRAATGEAEALRPVTTDDSRRRGRALSKSIIGQICVLTASGKSLKQIMGATGCKMPTVIKYIRRYWEGHEEDRPVCKKGRRQTCSNEVFELVRRLKRAGEQYTDIAKLLGISLKVIYRHNCEKGGLEHGVPRSEQRDRTGSAQDEAFTDVLRSGKNEARECRTEEEGDVQARQRMVRSLEEGAGADQSRGVYRGIREDGVLRREEGRG